jgi:hypothetical protein
MEPANRYALGIFGGTAAIAGAAYGISYARARRRFPGQSVPMNQAPQARYEGVVWAMAFGGASLLLGAAFMYSLGV